MFISKKHPKNVKTIRAKQKFTVLIFRNFKKVKSIHLMTLILLRKLGRYRHRTVSTGGLIGTVP
jgi:hypothetical protein